MKHVLEINGRGKARGSTCSVLTVQQVPDLVHVDLEVGHLDVELERLLHVVDVVEDVVHDPRDDTCR